MCLLIFLLRTPSLEWQRQCFGAILFIRTKFFQIFWSSFRFVFFLTCVHDSREMCGHHSLATPNWYTKREKPRLKYKQAHWAENNLTPKRNWTFDRHRLGNASRNKRTHFDVARNISFILFFSSNSRSIIQNTGTQLKYYNVCVCVCVCIFIRRKKWKERRKDVSFYMYYVYRNIHINSINLYIW